VPSPSPSRPHEDDAAAAGEHRSSVWRYVILLVLLLVALGVVLVLLGRQLGLLNTADSGAPVLAPPPPTAPVAIPADLIGKTFTDAANEVQGLGLRYARTDVEDTQHPQNTVVNTSPPAGTRIAGTEVITLDVSSGPLPITEPDVVGLDLQTATQTLQRAGFTVGPAQQQQAAYVPTGLVVSTTPLPGSQGHNGDTVTIVVSAPKGTVPVPDVAGDSQLQAAGVLVRAGFPVKVSNRLASATVPVGNVVSTDPPAGTNLLQGTSVGFVVSLGPNPVRVPYVQYDSASRAQSVLTADGLVVSQTTQAVSSSSRNGIVLDESPAPGTLVPAGSTVTLTVGQYGSG
jgi:serine/threonine-protein kinase